jgi:hypothetical protein
VQHYGPQILAEVLPRIKGVYPKRIMRDVAQLLQKMIAQDMEGVPHLILSILHQVCGALLFARNVYLCACAASQRRDAVSSGQLIPFQLWSSDRILFSP